MRSAGLAAVVARYSGGSTGARGRMWEVGVEIREYWKRYCTPLNVLGVPIPEEREQRERHMQGHGSATTENKCANITP